MNTTATESAQDVKLVTGVIQSCADGIVRLAIPNSNYLLELKSDDVSAGEVGARIQGVITAQARRVDKIRSGGRFIEPVEGPPRRIQGLIAAVDVANRTITVKAGAPVVCRIGDLQDPAQFEAGQMVTMGVKPGLTFTPQH